jgi:glycosyltransferase involved in cell wall biosynthesis
MRDSKPLVSVGLPTYNRASLLRRAIASVLAQDYPHLELVISDNCSTDETEALCTEFSLRDSRVRYIRQPVNRGMAFNFRTVLENARGEFFMWLGDDDWLDANLISRCMQVMIEQPDHAIVGGLSKHCGSGEEVLFEGERINLQQASGRERVLDYLRRVRHNGIFYGLMRREQLLRLPMPDTIGGDWLIISSFAFTGKVRMLEDTYVYRTDEGASSTLEATLRTTGLPLFFAKNVNLFYLKIASSAFRDILLLSPAYKSVGIGQRLSLAYAAARTIQKRWVRFQSPFVTARNFLDWVRSKAIIRTRLKRAIKGSK